MLVPSCAGRRVKTENKLSTILPESSWTDSLSSASKMGAVFSRVFLSAQTFSFSFFCILVRVVELKQETSVTLSSIREIQCSYCGMLVLPYLLTRQSRQCKQNF